ncbi:MAG: ArsR/SmtB family transcription factor [Woeseiaceae bacterium]
MNPATDSLLKQFKALSDPIKVRIVSLCAAAECSVSELTAVTGQSQPRISQHLKQLCDVRLLRRFRDGHFVYYRVPIKSGEPILRRRLLALLPDDEPQFESDRNRLRDLRSHDDASLTSDADRSLHRALLALTVSHPLGDLLDVGCGQGRLLKLLASRAHRVVGVDTDPAARRLARAEVLLAGLPNCTLRHGNMFNLPFADGEFDTIILDDVLPGAEEPQRAFAEAQRLLKTGGRILLLASIADNDVAELSRDFTDWAAAAGMRLARPRSIPQKNPNWLLAVATPADRVVAAA